MKQILTGLVALGIIAALGFSAELITTQKGNTLLTGELGKNNYFSRTYAQK